VVDTEGQPLLRDLPVVISNAALSEAGPRIARLWGALPEDDPAQHVLITFASHLLFVRRFGAGSLCVFVPPNVNKPALSMAAAVVARFLDEELSGSLSTPQPPGAVPGAGLPGGAGAPAAAGPGVASGPPSSAAPQKKRSFIYRGQRYEV
jgi:hypothetical protein